MKRNWVVLIIGLIIAAIISYNYIYQNHRDIANESAEYTMVASELSELFSKNLTSAEHKFLNKTIEVSGLVSEINTNDITINDKVFCQFTDKVDASLSKNDTIKIKGRVIGYDDLLEQVKLDQCSIIN
ncbi:hypothetical protein [Winogradskyella sp.]|uniref:OB-fold protein n=1 Tax=Winogradskyella sp. TaxID=1883156 RepID=UPI003511E7D5